MTISERMRRIKSTGNASTELALASVFRQLDITGWRRQQRIFGMRPDFIFRSQKIAVFVDGCFWHVCEVHTRLHTLTPTWAAKLARNMERDVFQTDKLAREGWRVLRVWEHELRNGGTDGLLHKLSKYEWGTCL